MIHHKNLAVLDTNGLVWNVGLFIEEKPRASGQVKLHRAKNMGLGGRENYLGLTHGGGLSGSSWATGTGDHLIRRMGHLGGEATGQVSEASEWGSHPDTKGGPTNRQDCGSGQVLRSSWACDPREHLEVMVVGGAGAL